MKKILTTITLIISFYANIASAFEDNLTEADVNRLLVKPMIQDLEVGEKSLISYSGYSFCLTNSKWQLVGNQRLITDPYRFLSYYEIFRQSDGTFTLSYGPNKDGKKEMPRFEASPTCSDVLQWRPDTTFFPIHSINGFTDKRSFITDLIKEGYN